MKKFIVYLLAAFIVFAAPARANIYISSLPVIQQTAEGNVYGNVPTYTYVGPDQSFAANRYHFIIGNLSPGTVNNPYLVVRILYLGVKPSTTASNSSFGSYWTLRKRLAPSTAPGALSQSYYSADSQDVPPSSDVQIGANPATSPVGGIIVPYDTQLIIDGEEPVGGTLNLPGSMFSNPFGSRPIFSWTNTYPGKPLVIRATEYLELQQSATAGAGNVSIICIFTIEISLSGAP